LIETKSKYDEIVKNNNLKNYVKQSKEWGPSFKDKENRRDEIKKEL